MDILQVNKFYYPDVGGVEQVVQSIAEGLPGTYSTHVLASNPRGIGDRSWHKGVSVTKASSIGMAMSVPLAPTFPLRLRTLARDVDIVHHHLPNPLSTVSELVARGDDATTVATYHSDIVRQANALPLYRPVLRRFLTDIDRIMVTSSRLLDHSAVLEPYKEKCEVIPLSVDLEAIDTEKPSVLTLDPEPTGPVILFVGRLNYYKGVEYLIDAMQRVDGTLLIAGDGDRRATLENRAHEQDVADQVRFLGYVSETRLASVYRRADLFVMPSVEPSEAFGIVQLEAMARGLPVVNTSLPTGVPWVSKDGETGLTVPPRDAVALADAMSTLIEDGALRRTYAKRARERVERLFTREQMIESMQEFYRRAIEDA